MAGWLSIPDTLIDYPVMWTPRDENYYLYKDFNGKKSSLGSLILDTDSFLEPLSTNLIIHGHNNTPANFGGSHEMFGDLDKYEDQAYAKEHPYIYLTTKDCKRKYEVLAVFRSKVFYADEVCFKFYKFFEARTEAEFKDFYDNVKALSVFDTGVEASFGDRFITLSTCAYHTENGRFVVVAKEIETTEIYEPFENKNN
jgi:sortase B